MIAKLVSKFLRNDEGNVALIVAIIALPLLLVAGIAVDYTLLTRAENALQVAADNAALASAKELGLSNSNSTTIKQVSEGYVLSNLEQDLDMTSSGHSVSIDTVIANDNSGLTVNLEYFWQPFILHHLGGNVLPLKVSATANLAGAKKICMLSLDPDQSKTIHLTQNASLAAEDCGVFSNSTQRFAIQVDDNAAILSGLTCSSGGVRAAKLSSFNPTALTDCPQITDPLSSRQNPVVGSCDHHNFAISSGIHILSPGTYCGGLRIAGTAEARLQPGIYIIKDEKFHVTDTAKVEGTEVGFYLTGDSAKVFFRKQTSVRLSAPETGTMAGMLIFENRANGDSGRHQITSDDARLLLGTIYIPNGTLLIDSDGPIADQSAYTAIVAKRIILAEGPTLTLNADYDATDVPVPDGLANADVYLAK